MVGDELPVRRDDWQGNERAPGGDVVGTGVAEGAVMGLRVRRSVGVGPARVNISKRGVSSVSTRLGPVTMNSRRGPTVHLAPGVSWSPSRAQSRPATRRAPATSPRKETSPAGAAAFLAALVTLGLAFLIGPWALLVGIGVFVGMATVGGAAASKRSTEELAAIRARTAANQAAMQENFRRSR